MLKTIILALQISVMSCAIAYGAPQPGEMKANPAYATASVDSGQKTASVNAVISKFTENAKKRDIIWPS